MIQITSASISNGYQTLNGVAPSELVRGIQVYLDDALISTCFYADETTGIIRRYKQDATGHILVEKGEVQTEELHGRVELRFNGP